MFIFRDVAANFTDEIIPIALWNITLTNADDEEVGPWIFGVILAGAMFLIFFIIGLCVLSHVAYMKFLKKP